MVIEKGNFSQESEVMQEMQVGVGDPIKVGRAEKITYKSIGIDEKEST